MKLIVHGQQAYGKAVLQTILEKGIDEIVAVYCAPDQEGRPMDPIKELALEKGLPVHQPSTYKDPAVWELMTSHEADLCVMAYVLLFVPEEALNIPRLGSIQYHPSLLPMHKGPSSINWPIIAGSKKAGLSIFWPDNGLDTGPILLQKIVDIEPDDTLGSVYFNKLFPLGVEAMIEAIDLVRYGVAPKLHQEKGAGTYEGWCKKAQAKVDWSKPVDEVYNLIRGTNPQPGAWTTLAGAEVKLFDSQKVDDVVGEPGQVTSLDDEGIVVACDGGGIRIQKVRPAGSGKISAAEFSASAGIEAGTLFGN
ncbi:MAG: methionyl-tRNA formyltransferase [Parasphingorhabdus sp.]|jgi:methionyl-tRNA formyltransferase